MSKRYTCLPGLFTISIKKEIRLIKYLSLLILFMNSSFLLANNGDAEIFCNPVVNVALDNNCQAEIDPDEILEGTYPSYAIFTINVPGYAPGNTVTITAPGTYSVSVTDPTGNFCWSTLEATDGFPPVLTCSNVSLDCTANTDPVPGPPVAGVPAAYEPTVVEPCGGLSLSHTDVVTNGTCANPFRQRIERTWTGTNSSGLTGTCVQTITVQRASTAGTTAPANFDDFDEPSFSCTDSVSYTHLTLPTTPYV